MLKNDVECKEEASVQLIHCPAIATSSMKTILIGNLVLCDITAMWEKVGTKTKGINNP